MCAHQWSFGNEWDNLSMLLEIIGKLPHEWPKNLYSWLAVYHLFLTYYLMPWTELTPTWWKQTLITHFIIIVKNSPDSKVHGANMEVHLGLTGPRWAPCWPHEPCYLGAYSNLVLWHQTNPRHLCHLFHRVQIGTKLIFTYHQSIQYSLCSV